MQQYIHITYYRHTGLTGQ